ncbi:MAG: TonB-dependent receptor [Rhodocyclaceae bacterium]|nr:TonB-dependent receptor [Rhodocyclaceae bacterium]MCA3081222.1 TonB-dependent receptor [Rhodocyclaceae bacterium]
MKKKYMSVAIAALFATAGSAYAQQAAAPKPAAGTSAPASAEKADDGKVESIVVTARRRDELLQDVPGAVTAIGGAFLEKAGIPDVTALADIVPNTTLKASRATNTTLTAFIRGVGQQDPLPGFEQGVGIYLDDIYLSRPQGALTDIYDLERIEVLRGPQGTLYGRNTIGGAVKYVTRKLADKAEFSVKGTLGSYNQRDLVVRASTPVTDGFKLGGTVATFNRDGFGTNVVNGKDNYNKDVTAGRISAEFTPNSSLFIRLAADRTIDDSNPKQGYRLTPGVAPGNEPVLGGNYDTRANLYSVLGKAQQVKTWGHSLLVDLALTDNLSVKAIAAHRADDSVAPIDFDSLNSALFEAPAFYRNKQDSQELQFTYTGSKWQGVAGVFFMKANAFAEFDVLFNASGGLSLYTLGDFDTKTWAAFADATYNVSNTFNVTIGGRQTSDKREARIFKRNYLGLAGSPTLGNPAAIALPVLTDMSKSDLSRTDTKFTPKVGFGWKFAPEQNLYGSYSEGFKGGSFDPRMDLGGVPTSAASLAKRKGVEPEVVKTFELGLKSAFNNGRVQTNIAAFTTDYTNVQIPGSVPTFNAAGAVVGFSGSLTNAGKAKINGLELEATARLTDAFRLTGMVSFIDAKYKEWLVANPATLALVNIAGSAEFQNTPKQSANITGTYDWAMPVMGRSGTLSLSNSFSYKSKIYQGEIVKPTGIAALDANVAGAQLIAQDAYTVWDAGLVWTSRDRNLQVALNGRNLTDKRYKTAGYLFGGFFNTVTTFYGDPRTVKASVSVKF